MTSRGRGRFVFSWTAPKSLVATLVFILVVVIAEYAFVSATAAEIADPAAILMPFANVSLSPSYHLLPAAVIIALTACFVHLTHFVGFPPTSQPGKRASPQRGVRKSARLKSVRQFVRRLQRSGSKLKRRIWESRAIVFIRMKVAPAEALVRSATTVTALFVLLVLLFTVAAYPGLVPAATVDFYSWNTLFLGFVMATIRASQAMAAAIPPLGAAASAIHGALISAAPAFHNALEAVGSSLVGGLVTLDPVTKFLVAQNVAAWAVAIVTLTYTEYVKSRRYRR